MDVAFYLSYGALWLIVVIQGILLIGLVRLSADRRGAARPDEQRPLAAGNLAPTFSARDLTGTEIRFDQFSGESVALLFVSTTCRACSTTLDELSALIHKMKGHVVIVCSSGQEACSRLAEQHHVALPIIPDAESRITGLYHISQVPTAVIVDESGYIQSIGHPERDDEVEPFLAAGEAASITQMTES